MDMFVDKTQRWRFECGQSSVEAACAIPVLFTLLLLLLQPGIVMYDRVVMASAAAEGCRLLATATAAQGDMEESCEAFIRHRLSAVPQHECFHVHEGGCSWDIQMIGGEGVSTATVRIGNEYRPLPLLDVAATLLGLTNERGNIEMSVETTLSTQPAWVTSAPMGLNPGSWPGTWSE